MALRYTLRQLEYFVTVGEEGSIALASQKVNVSPPSISAAISQLEAQFGLKLFARKHAHGLSLSQGGRQLMVQAKQVLAEADKLNDLANQITGSVRGPLDVGCLVTFAQMVLPQIRKSFEAKYPEVALHQEELDQAEIFNKLRRAEVDVALTYDLSIPTNLQFEPLATLSAYAVVAEDHPLAAEKSLTIAQLQPFPIVLLDLPFSANYFLSLFDQEGLEPKVAERTRDMAVMRSLVGNGFGYSIANIRDLSGASPDGKPLRYIPLAGDVAPLTMGLVMIEGAQTSLMVKAFVEHCRAAVTPETTPGLQPMSGSQGE